MTTLAEVLREQRNRQDAREEGAVQRVTSIYDALQADLEQRLFTVNTLIADAQRTGEPVNSTWLHRQARYRILLDEVDYLERLYIAQADRSMRDATIAELRAGTLDALERANVMTPAVGVSTVNYQAVERLADALSAESPVRKVLQGYGSQHVQAIESALLNGIGSGDSVDDIMRAIVQQVGDVTSPWRLRSLIRTEGMRAYNASLIDQYENIPEVVGYVWQTHRGPRTCLACLALDQTVYARKDDIPGRHVNCRCSISPEPQDMYPSVRRYLNQRGSSDEWLRKQPAASARRHFPSDDAYNAFMRGEVSLKDFVGTTSHAVYGTSIYQKSARQVLGDAA